MLLRRCLALVGNRTRSLNINNVNHCWLITNVGGFNMLPTFEDLVFLRVNKKFNSTNATKLENQSSRLVDDEYKAAIKALNNLQSNAETLRISIERNNGQVPLDSMYTCLEASGMSIHDLNKMSFLHVSGTKGKGSTCALTEAILRAHGIKTGFFSSPHLISVTERIRINGEPIATAKFNSAFWRIYRRLQAVAKGPGDMPGYFMFLTILCFHIFHEERVDVAILEVGIGGELDCTNIIRNTKTVGITSLGLDHTNLLGNTLREIAWQKAGIIKPQSNVYTNATQPECLEVIKQRTMEKNAIMHIVPEITEYFPDADVSSILDKLNTITILNGSLSIQLAYDWLRNYKNGFHLNYGINNVTLSAKVLRTLIDFQWPGRCQLVKLYNFNIYLDGAHTAESAQVCTDWFNGHVKNSKNPRVLIFNTTGERNAETLLSLLRTKSKFTVACFVPNASSSSTNLRDTTDNTSLMYANVEYLKRVKLNVENWMRLDMEAGEPQSEAYAFDAIIDCLNFLQKRYGSQQIVDILITGSVHLVGAAILALGDHKRCLDTA